MSWNYRIVKKKDLMSDEPFYEVHEAYYNPDGSIYAITTEAITPYGDSVEELKQVFEYIQAAFEKDVLTEGEIKFVDNHMDDVDYER